MHTPHPHPGIPHTDLLAIHDEFEARYWARTLGVSKQRARELLGTADTHPEPAQKEAKPLSIAAFLHRAEAEVPIHSHRKDMP